MRRPMISSSSGLPMSNDSWRLILLCEDRRTERFLRRLCERYNAKVQDVVVAPAGKQDASEWVKRQYPDLAAKWRSKNYQKTLGLLVAIDGDNHGVAARHSELDAELERREMRRRTAQESIALFVPTWSIETWLALLCGKTGLVEDKSVKDDEDFSYLRKLWKDGSEEAATLKQAALAWRGDIATLPSLEAAYSESKRVGFP